MSSTSCSFEENIFELFEKDKFVKIPPHLKNLLIFTGFDSIFSLSRLEDTDITEIELIGRKTVPKLIQNECLGTYLGPFSVNPQEFFIFPGHKKKLQELANYCKNYTPNTKKRPNNNYNNTSDSNDSVNNKKQKFQDATSSSSASLLNFYLSQESPSTSSESEVTTNTKKVNSAGRDIVSEEQHIYVNLINWVNNFCSKDLSEEELEFVSRELPKMKVNISGDDYNHCLVTCCVCQKEQKMFRNRNGLWIKSNFHKHFRTHLAVFHQKKFRKNMLIGGSPADDQSDDYIDFIENPVKDEDFLEDFQQS